MTTELQSPAADRAASGAADTCPSCSSTDVQVFHRSESLPVNSCILLNDVDTARSYPQGQLRLGFCRACGFISNLAFNPELTRYNDLYEEQQSFSPRFNAFATELADRWINTHGIREKTILEVGCGKGDFLILMCERGNNKGIGIDPSYIPTRSVSSQVEFIADFYSTKYTHLQADAVVCRHTLEHIPDTEAFMRMIRASIGDRPKTHVLFELPDVHRVLNECAFWDIYYEHCSYFTLGSLARLFRRTGFDVHHLSKDYDDQYLLIEATPNDGIRPTPAPLAEEDDLAAIADSVAAFQVNYKRIVEHWRSKIEACRANGQRVAVWGSGSKCVAFLNTLRMNEEIGAIVDINPHRHDKFLPGTGKRISSPQSLREFKPDLVIAMNPIYLGEIGKDLASMDLHPELTAV